MNANKETRQTTLFSFELNSHEKTTANQFSQFYTDDKEISANTSVKAKSRLNLNFCVFKEWNLILWA